jgi:hypothetical protein
MRNIEFIILSCDKYLSTRVQTIKETWGYGQNVKFLVDSETTSIDCLGFNTEQNYNGIYHKYLSFFKYYY